MAGQKGNTNKPIDGKKRERKILIRLTDEEIEKIEKIANDLDIPIARFVRNLTLASLDEASFLNKIGALKGAQKLIDFKERFFKAEKYKTLQEA
jgi:hypothetical protein